MYINYAKKPYPWNGIILMLLKLPKLRQKFQKWKKQYPLQKSSTVKYLQKLLQNKVNWISYLQR